MGGPRRDREDPRRDRARALALPLVLAVLAPGCASSRLASVGPDRERAVEAQAPSPSEAPGQDEPDVPEGVFHRVERGQTLWRIARAYGVPLEDLLAANGISEPTDLATGRMLFVPGATALLHVPPYPAPPPPEMPRPSDVPPRASAPAPAVPSAPEAFAWPVTGGEILSRYGAPRRGRRHAGVDIRGPKGHDILATRGGEVAYSGSALRGYGKMVVLDHGDGLQSVYAHASELLVKTGDRVERGQSIARIGRTGNATTEHCHFEIRKDRVPVDPLPYFPEIARSASGDAPMTGSTAAAAKR